MTDRSQAEKRSLAPTEVPSSDAERLLRGLRTKEVSVAVWGSGAIGSSAAFYFARVGFRCIAYDISKERAREIQEGHFQSTSADIDTSQDRGHLAVTATTRWQSLEAENVAVHLVCIPTERAAEPSSAALSDVMPRIARVVRKVGLGVAPLVSIESTIMPSWLDTIVIPTLQAEGLTVGEDVLVGAAPRRDWFNGASHTIENLPRIVGGCDARTTQLMASFYREVSASVQPAMDARHAAFTKVIENVIRYQGITFANSLALAFPDFDMRHLLRLASTKWNIPHYYPSLGVGGHCIPLAPQYLLEEGGGDNPYLQSIRDAIAFNENYFERLRDRRLKEMLAGRRSVGVLGLAYTPDAKMHKLSPAFAVLEALADTPRLRMHDPFYSADEIYDLCSVPSMQFPEDVQDCDAIVLVTGHSAYADAAIEKHVEPGTVVIDNTGIWRGRSFKPGVEYYEVGRLRGRMPDGCEPYSSLAS